MMCRMVARTWARSAGASVVQIRWVGRAASSGGSHGGAGPGAEANGRGSWRGGGLGRCGAGFTMGVLLTRLSQGRYHSKQGVEAGRRELAPHWGDHHLGAAGCRERNSALNAWIQFDDADAAEPLHDGDADERQGESAKWVGRISDGDRFVRQCRCRERGIL